MNIPSDNFQHILKQHAQAVEARLELCLSPQNSRLSTNQNRNSSNDAGFWPPRLLAAMRHGVFNGGKRLRPFLLLESTALLAADASVLRKKQMEAALECAAALEAVHCYSLIHDDLPSMDNDDWRRGRPSVHKAYDEATALLAGDALLSLAFQLLGAAACRNPALLSSKVAATLSLRLAQAAGASGMIGGQMLDILAENQTKSAEDIIRLEMMKTGALLRFACTAGTVITKAGVKNAALLENFGRLIGFTFQLADDILDQESNSKVLGKTAGKDAASGKATLVALWGVEKARSLLRQKTEEAQDILAPFGQKASILRQTAQFIACRDY